MITIKVGEKQTHIAKLIKSAVFRIGRSNQIGLNFVGGYGITSFVTLSHSDDYQAYITVIILKYK